MRITDLGLTPSLRESLPASIQADLDLAMIRKIDDKIRLQKELTRRKKKLARVFKKIEQAADHAEK
tara:strand:- start:229 stop:426 length:198 start_codon:yes stop_codon:yes gene_type:complete